MRTSIVILVLILLFSPICSFAESPHVGMVGFGLKGAWWEPKDADESTLFYGALARIRLSNTFAIEGTLDYYKEELDNGVDMILYPVQASLLIYLVPSRILEIYALGGAGWYYYEYDSPENKDQKGDDFAWQAGVGVELPLMDHLSFHGDVRWVYFKPDIEVSDYDDWSGVWTNLGFTVYF